MVAEFLEASMITMFSILFEVFVGSKGGRFLRSQAADALRRWRDFQAGKRLSRLR